MIESGAVGWPVATIVGLATLRELFRFLAYVAGLAIVVRGTSPGDRSAVLRAYDRKRFGVASKARP